MFLMNLRIIITYKCEYIHGTCSYEHIRMHTDKTNYLTFRYRRTPSDTQCYAMLRYLASKLFILKLQSH